MSKAVMMSIKPKWCELIANGKKTIEVRKSKPKLEPPFKVYIYCTSGPPYLNSHNGYCYLEDLDVLGYRGQGLYSRLTKKVIGEFVCNRFTYIEAGYDTNGNKHLYNTAFIEHRMCIPDNELHEYLYKSRENCRGWAWHISDIKIYEHPLEINKFVSASTVNTNCFGQHLKHLDRAPQSWCYVEEVNR